MDPRQLPYLHISGTVSSGGNPADTFELEPTQYSSALKNLKDTDPSVYTFPVRCQIKDSPRYKNGKKPQPRNGTMVSLEGFLTSITKNSVAAGAERFHIEVENLVFMGRASVAPPKVPLTPSKYPSCS